jgi:hypothetical protein
MWHQQMSRNKQEGMASTSTVKGQADLYMKMYDNSWWDLTTGRVEPNSELWHTLEGSTEKQKVDLAKV